MANRKPLVFVGGEIAQLPDGDTSTPTGTAGGVLSGEFPNPGFAQPMATQSSLAAHTGNSANPHNTTKAQVGLGNVDNTSDANKPVSAAQAAANTAVATAAAADATTKANAAQAAAIAASTPVAHATNTGNPHSTTKAQVGLGNVDNTSDVNKPVSTAQAAADVAATNAAKTYTDGLISSGIKFPNGSIAAPGIAFSSDPDTGLRNINQGVVSLVLNGFDRVVASATETEFRGYVRSVTANGGAIVGNRDASPSWFLGDLKEATGSGAGMVNWVYGNNPFHVYINGVERAKVTASGLTVGGAIKSTNGAIEGGVSYSTRAEMGAFSNHDLGLITNNVTRAILDLSGNFSLDGNLKLLNQQFLSTGSFGRIWGNAALAVGQATFAGLYGTTITYNAKIVGGVWKSIGGGTATAVTTDEGIFAIAQSQSVGAADVNLTWTTNFVVDPAGNMGLGAIPKAWDSAASHAADFGTYTSLWDLNSGSGGIAVNAYRDSGGWKRKTYNPSGNYLFDIPTQNFVWSTAVGDLAGSAITWRDNMKVSYDRAFIKGYLDIDGGGTTPWALTGGSGPVISRNGSDSYLTTYYDQTSVTIGAGVSTKTGITIYGQTHSSGNKIDFRVGNAVRMSLDAAGVLSPSQLKTGRVTLPVIIRDTNDTNYGNDIYIPYDAGGSTQRSFRFRSSYNGGSIGQLRLGMSTNSGAQYSDPGALTYVEPVRFNADTSVQFDSDTNAKGLVVSALSTTASQVNVGIGFLTAGRPFVGTNTSSNPLEFGTRASSPLLFVTSAAERMQLTTSGELLLGRTSIVSGNAAFSTICADGGSRFGLVVANKSAANTSFAVFANNSDVAIGSITQSGSAVAYNTTSDYRLKTNVRNSDARRFMQIRFRDYERLDGRHECGVIAHELQEIYPDLVSGVKDAVEIREVEIEAAVVEERLVSEAVPTVYDGDQIVSMGKDAVYETVVVTPAVTEMKEFPVYQQVNYQGLIGRMGTVIQQQHRALEAMTARVDELEKLVARIEALENKLNK